MTVAITFAEPAPPPSSPKATYSPGPWVLAKSGVSVDAGATRIRMEASADREEIKANARLIAAAPDLLEACRFAVGYIGPAETVLNVLHAAIAKAEGR